MLYIRGINPRGNMTVQLPKSVFEFQRATLAARARLNDRSIGTQVNERGLVRVVSTTYPAGRSRSDVKPLSDWLPQPEAMKFIQSMQ
jgi:hypothetical protein